MEPLREWFCKGADMTSAAEYEAALVQLEEEPPDIRQYNANTRDERWTNFSLEGVRFPAMTVDVIQRGEALAIFERDLIIHFQQISKAAALYVRAQLGGIKRALEIYRRVDESTKTFPWSMPTTEEKWHAHAEGVLMVALTTLNLPTEAWKSARLLRAVPNCRLVLMMAYHMLSPALSVEENGLMATYRHHRKQDHLLLKRQLAFRIGNAQEEDWLREEGDFPQPLSCINHSSRYFPST